MYSQLKPFSLMGMSNSDILLSETDLEFNFLVRPALEFEEDEEEHSEIAPSEDSDGIHDQEQEQEQERQELQQQQQQQKEGDKKCKLVVSSLKIKLPSLKTNQEQDVDNYEDGLKTPTSLEKRIPLVLPCPPAPRKPKSLPCNKRKSLPAARRRVLLDLSNEIESLFPPSCVLGGKIKKVRPEKDNN